MEMFDTIAASERGAYLHLENPVTEAPAYELDSEGKPDKTRPIRIKMVGVDSAAFRDNIRNRSTKMIKRRAGGLNLKKMTEDQIKEFLVQQEDSAIEDAADATIGWENIGMNGEPLEFSRDNAVKLYTAFPEILRQVTLFRTNIANFMTKA